MAAFQVPSSPLDASPWVNHQGSLPPEVDIEGNIEYKVGNAPRPILFKVRRGSKSLTHL